MKGYKVFNKDWTCRNKQYTCPGYFEENVKPYTCKAGMHFCQRLIDCFDYYGFNSDNHVAEVEAVGDVDISDETKFCTNKLMIIREIPWDEVLRLVNTGKNCTGKSNSGNCNSGNWNSGDCNSGDRNSGNCNSGNCNSGNCNSGNCNSGDWNSGDWNSGDSNSGKSNSGNCNSGNWNSGDCNSGNRNSGNWNSGDWNSGNWNSGDWNSGNRNSGNCNSGKSNSGNCNSGNWNSGDCNSGNRNSGDWNSGDWNLTNHSAGCFCTEEQHIKMFDKETNWTIDDWYRSNGYQTMLDCPQNTKTTEWIREEQMSEEEKKDNPTYKITGGYLKVDKSNEDLQKWWDNLKQSERQAVYELPNFDAEKFYKCTGIKVDIHEISGK